MIDKDKDKPIVREDGTLICKSLAKGIDEANKKFEESLVKEFSLKYDYDKKCFLRKV